MTDTFLDALESLYEETLISKTVLVCLNDDAVADYTAKLSALNFSVIKGTARGAIQAFQETPNTILVLSLGRWKAMDEASFRRLMAAGWNVLASVDVPSYHMDAIYEETREARTNETSEDAVHLLWFLH